MLSLLATLLIVPPKRLDLLFVGNSHTSMNDVPGRVRRVLVGKGYVVTTDLISGGHLEDIAGFPAFREKVAKHHDIVVLQAAMVSSSHKFRYRQDGGILLAKLALKAKSRVLLFSEWSRTGWDETQYTFNVYKEIAAAAPGCELVGVGFAFDSSGQTGLVSSDGNHASPKGSELAARVIADAILHPHKWSKPTARLN